MSWRQAPPGPSGSFLTAARIRERRIFLHEARQANPQSPASSGASRPLRRDRGVNRELTARKLTGAGGPAPAGGGEPGISLLLVGMCAALGPFASHSIIPLLPPLQEAFGVSYSQMQLSVSLYLIALACGQLVIGSLSDRYGQSIVLLSGLSLFVLTSVALGFGNGILLFLALRVVQGLVGSTGIVIARAMIGARDDGMMVSRNSVLMAGLSVSTMLAPFLGGIVAQTMGWRMVFILMGAAGAILFALLLHRLRPDMAARAGTGTVRGMPGFSAALRMLSGNRIFIFCVAMIASSVGAFYFIIGAAPYLTTHLLGMSEVANGTWFMVVALGLPLGAVLSTQLSPRLGSNRAMTAGCAIMLAAVGIAGLATVLGVVSAWTIFGPIFFLCIGMTLAISNAQARAVSVIPAVVGTAAGLSGALQFGAGAAFSLLGAIAAETFADPLFVLSCTGAISLVSLVLTVIYSRKVGNGPEV